MLEFTDRPKAIRVHRRDKFNKVRVPVATINKATFAVVADRGVELSNEEIAEIQSIVELVNGAEQIQRQVWALKLPVYLREALDYCAQSATDLELAVLATAVAQAHSRLNQMMVQRKAAKLV